MGTCTIKCIFFYPPLSSEVQYGTVNIFYVCTTSVENCYSKVIIDLSDYVDTKDN